ncbi:OXR1 protein, partial [Polypterus senegalus]
MSCGAPCLRTSRAHSDMFPVHVLRLGSQGDASSGLSASGAVDESQGTEDTGMGPLRGDRDESGAAALRTVPACRCGAAVRLKKKSQSVDITAQGYTGPLVPEAHASQINKPPPVVKTTTSEEEENNAANSQRRNPRRSDLKRYYTIGKDHQPPVCLSSHLLPPSWCFLSFVALAV